MIFFKQNLYLGETAAREKGKIIRNIRKHKLQLGVYVIALCVNGKDIFDIIPSFMLGDDSYKGRDITVIGLAKGREEAFELAGQMLLEVINKDGWIENLANAGGDPVLNADRIRSCFL